MSRENRRPGEKHGSARWGNVKSVVRKYEDKDNYSNIILSQNMRLGLNAKKHRRNLNVLVVGGSGAGKTRFYAKPNLMQCNTSFIVADPKGTILVECGKMLQKGGYKIRSLNTINFKKSMHYNPFAYIRSEKDILKLVNVIIANTNGDGEKSGEDFWVKAERLLYCALHYRFLSRLSFPGSLCVQMLCPKHRRL